MFAKKHKCEGFIGSKRCGKPAIGVIRKGGMLFKVCPGCQGSYKLIEKLEK